MNRTSSILRTTSHAPGLRLALARRDAALRSPARAAKPVLSAISGAGMAIATEGAEKGVEIAIEDSRPLLYDVCCKAGGATRGYQLAGFRVVGIDIEPQKNYIGDGFIQMDAIEFLERYLRGEYPEAAVFHASPPCQTHTQLNNIKKIKASTTKNYVDLIAPIRPLLIATGKPYVIENVPGARKHLIKPKVLCGSYFTGLKVYRHRLFESNFQWQEPEHTPHRDQTPAAGCGVSPKGFISINAGGNWNIPEGYTPKGYKSMAMGIDWMTADELTEAIPPVYAQYIGAEWLRQNGYRYVYPSMNVPVRLSMFERWEAHRPTAGESAERVGTENGERV